MSKQVFSKWLPSRESIEKIRHLKILGPLLARPWLWHLNRRSVAAGLAAGVFIGFIVPMGLQVPVAAVLAVWARANLAAAVLSTLVSNPFTVAPIYLFAYRLGVVLSGIPPAPWSSTQVSTVAKIATVGAPLMLGLVVLGVVGGTVTYFAAHGLWRLFARRAWERRRRLRALKRAAKPGPT